MAVPTTQKAIVIPDKGGREVIKYTEVPVPEVGEGDVLIKNEYAGLNFIDSYFRSGLYPISYPYTAGREAAGTIVAIGSKVSKFAVGDRVAYMSTGAFAEYTSTAASGTVLKIPAGISTKTAAASLLQGLTAVTLVKEAYDVKKDDYVLVQAAAGGMGLLLTQLCAGIGAHVIGTVSTAEKAALAKKAGAETVINYAETPDYVGEVVKASEGKGVHVAFDGVGKATFDASIGALRRKGSMISFGNASGSVPPVPLPVLTSKNLKLMRPTLFNYIAEEEELEYYSELLWKEVASGVLDIAVYKEFGLAEYADAAESLETRKSTGKVLLKI
ncbi:hypothetical protein BZA70DRAFT_242912 [Myxozyma melibiosi]|uniref:Enoyl reductase (ER) domain-containing protein n=1 Tax=Myxozyma melibiosi TaxID=54550 RepID=A0ABR1EXU0_9ASCO